jgi:hypothetical protein
LFKKLKSLFSFFASKSSIIFAEARALVQPREPCPALIKKLEKLLRSPISGIEFGRNGLKPAHS